MQGVMTSENETPPTSEIKMSPTELSKQRRNLKRKAQGMTSCLELHDAAATNDFEALEKHINSGTYDIDGKDPEWYSRTPLHLACARGFISGIRLLLRNGAKGAARTIGGWTPAHYAAETGKLNALRILHEANVPIDRKDKYGATPHAISTFYKQWQCMRFLLEAEVEQKDRRKKLNIKDNPDDDYN